jgi:hypothetical protein
MAAYRRALIASLAMGLTVGQASLFTPAAHAGTAEYCDTIVALANAGEIQINVVPTDTVNQAIGKVDVFKRVWIKILAPAPAGARPLLKRTIADVKRIRADLVGAKKHPSRQSAYVAKFESDFELVRADLREFESDTTARCGVAFPSTTDPSAPAPTTPAAQPSAPPTNLTGPGVAVGGWTFRATAVRLNVNAEVAAANSFNRQPAAGRQFVAITVDVLWNGQGPAPTADVAMDLLTTNGERILTESLVGFDYPQSMVVTPGQPKTFNFVYSVASDQVNGSLTLAINSVVGGTANLAVR